MKFTRAYLTLYYRKKSKILVAAHFPQTNNNDDSADNNFVDIMVMTKMTQLYPVIIHKIYFELSEMAS